ncbi:MAG: hypothetical protein K2K91_10080 [Ruminococcus sp.]|nr:hypothetical protein [Ruminococcus sp.]MDE7097978.1 hypothetical protein [Ruminococcus sp.]
MNIDYVEMFKRSSRITSDINLFENSVFTGFVKPEVIYDLSDEYYKTAVEKSRFISWDYIILYAVYEYEENHQNIISANFLTLEIPYGIYTGTIKKLQKIYRFFFVRGKKECYYE